MENLKIGTWNIKNSYFNLSKNNLKSASVVQLLTENELDILVLQEVNSLLAKKIEERLENLVYQITSSYEKTWNPIKNLRIEFNMIISRVPALFSSNMITLSSDFRDRNRLEFWNYRTRNIVIQTFEDGLIINTTHLDPTSKELNCRQMAEIMEIVSSQKRIGRSIILAGNLNQKSQEKNMIRFVDELSKSGMKVIESPHKTYIGHKEEQPVDYIIVSEDWQVEFIEVLENYEDVSTHRPVVAELKKR